MVSYIAIAGSMSFVFFLVGWLYGRSGSDDDVVVEDDGRARTQSYNQAIKENKEAFLPDRVISGLLAMLDLYNLISLLI